MFRAILALPVIVVSCAVFGGAACLAGLLDRSGRAGYWVGRLWGRLVVRSLGIRVVVEEAGNAPSSAAVFVVNHSSAIDIPLLFGWLPARFRFIYKRSLIKLPFIGWSLPLNGHVSVDRTNPWSARRSLEAADRQLRRGVSVLAFPEGTRSADETLRRFKRGPFVLAIDAHVPVVPISLVGVRRIVGRGVRGFRSGSIRLRVHPPVSTEGCPAEEATTLADSTRQTIEAGCVP